MAQLKQIQDLPGLCTAVVSSFWNKWDSSRQFDFYTYCQTILGYINVSPSVVYTRYAVQQLLLWQQLLCSNAEYTQREKRERARR